MIIKLYKSNHLEEKNTAINPNKRIFDRILFWSPYHHFHAFAYFYHDYHLSGAASFLICVLSIVIA